MPPDRQPQHMWSPALSTTIVKPVIAVVMGVSGSGKTTVCGPALCRTRLPIPGGR